MLLQAVCIILVIRLSTFQPVQAQAPLPVNICDKCRTIYDYYKNFPYLAQFVRICIARQCPLVNSTQTTPSTWPTSTTPVTTRTTTTRNGECGLQTQSRYRIVGGRKAGECEFPWIVGVSFKELFCGGSILDRFHVLTAAHCLRDRFTREVAKPQEVVIRAGSSQLSMLKTYAVVQVNIDTRHVPGINNYDAAILTVAGGFNFTHCTYPICLPEAGDDAMNTNNCVAAGWGRDNTDSNTLRYDLQKVELPIVDFQLCRKSYGDVVINDLKLCAGNYNFGGVDTCQGDSGGPLMCFKDGRAFVYGIVSSGTSCAKPFYPGIYTRVSNREINSFIRNTSGLN